MALNNEEKNQIHELAQMLEHPGWKAILNYAKMMLKTDVSALVQPKREGMPDDFMRGRISVFTWLTTGIYDDVQRAIKEEQEPEPQAVSQPEAAGDPYSVQ